MCVKDLQAIAVQCEPTTCATNVKDWCFTSISLRSLACATVVIFRGTASGFTGICTRRGFVVYRVMCIGRWHYAVTAWFDFWYILFLFWTYSPFVSGSHTLEKRACVLQGTALQGVPNVLCASWKEGPNTAKLFCEHLLKSRVSLKALIRRNWGLNRPEKGSCWNCFPDIQLAVFVDGLFLQWPTSFYPILTPFNSDRYFFITSWSNLSR